MANEIKMEYKKKSPLFFYLSPLIAFLGKSKTFNGIDSIPKISTRISGTTIDIEHLERFNRLCSIEPPDIISPVYPITLAFPFFQRILSNKQAPLSMFRVLGKRLQIIQAKALSIDEHYDIHCSTSEARIVEKGLELDLEARILSGDEVVWRAVETFFYRGSFGKVPQNEASRRLKPLSDPRKTAEWFLPEGIGYQFAKISGDSNGLHYSKRYAKLFGFERDFAQPFLIVGQALEAMEPIPAAPPLFMDVTFKGQCYYNRHMRIQTEADLPQRFDIYCQGNDRPCMSAYLDSNPASNGK